MLYLLRCFPLQIYLHFPTRRHHSVHHKAVNHRMAHRDIDIDDTSFNENTGCEYND